MNKRLNEKISMYMQWKVNELRMDAEMKAKSEFENVCVLLEEGKFTPVAEDKIEVYAENIGRCDENCLWQNFFDNKLNALFADEGICLKKIQRSSELCGYLYLKI